MYCTFEQCEQSCVRWFFVPRYARVTEIWAARQRPPYLCTLAVAGFRSFHSRPKNALENGGASAMLLAAIS
jgi:hypothetical protein